MKPNRLYITLSFIIIGASLLFAQTTYNPKVRYSNSSCTIEMVELTEDETIVTVQAPRLSGLDAFLGGGWIRISSKTIIMPTNNWSIKDARILASGYCINESSELKALNKDGWLIRGLGDDLKLDTKYKITDKKYDFYYLDLHFNRLPYGCEDFYIIELEPDGFEWTGIQIKNPYPEVPNIGLNEIEIKKSIDETKDGIVGIYEGFEGNKYKLACIKDSGEYKLVYLGAVSKMRQWNLGDVKAKLRPTAKYGFFKADWYNADKSLSTDVYVMFSGGEMKVNDGFESHYLKMYPITEFVENSLEKQVWTGTGFALKKGYVITNYHVVEGAKNINIQKIDGSLSDTYKATVVSSDKNNDLALLKIIDDNFKGFGVIPYNVKMSVSDVGESVFVLGYPLTDTMGDELKLTTGVLSSKTGFQGDVSLYQISAPVQPGNSGGPLFDNKGNIIGIVSAKHDGAENVGYAIKTSYLKNLIESSASGTILPSSNQVANLSLTNKVKVLNKFVFKITCSK